MFPFLQKFHGERWLHPNLSCNIFIFDKQFLVSVYLCTAGDSKAFIESIKQALYASKIVSYAQGFMLMRETARELGWKLNFGGIALMWRGGCIIRRSQLVFTYSL